jgi:ribosomal protein L35
MTVIAMTQEMGSLGKDVALQTAEALGLTVVRDEMISDIVAGKMKKRKSAIRRFKEGNASLRERLGVSRKSLAVYSATEVYEYAAKGDVLIRGWGATTYKVFPMYYVCAFVLPSRGESSGSWKGWTPTMRHSLRRKSTAVMRHVALTSASGS